MIDPSGTPRHQDHKPSLSVSATPAEAAAAELVPAAPPQAPPQAPLQAPPQAPPAPPARVEVSADDAANAAVLMKRYKNRLLALGQHRHQALLQERALEADIEEASAAVDAYVRVLRERYIKNPSDNSAPYTFVDGVFIRG